MPSQSLQDHYDRNADATGHASNCRRRIPPTVMSDSRICDPDRCARCRYLQATHPAIFIPRPGDQTHGGT